MNSNELDDLFKRAAEQFPLRTDSADWSAVERALDDESSNEIPPPNFWGRKRSSRKLLLLLLLLPIAAIGYLVIPKHANAPIADKISKPAGINASTKENGKKEGAKDRENTLTTKSTDISHNAIPDKKTGTQLPAQLSTPQSSTAGSLVLASATGRSAKKGNATRTSIGIFGKAANPKRIGKNDKLSQFADESFSAGNNRQNAAVNNDKSGPDNDKPGPHLFSLNPAIQQITTGPFDIRVNEISSANTASLIPLATTASKSNGDRKMSKPKTTKQSFYVGVIVAPDLSNVKFQSIRGAGYTAGLLLGYNLSPKFALETGVYFDSKKYYSDGEYFSSKNVSFLNYVNLLNVDGNCNMFEVPINLRYNIQTAKRSQWFLTTGLSTYFMFRESYDYKYVYNGTPGEGAYTYRKSSQYWFSIVNVSAGYQYKLGRIGDLRLEPYLRIPLSGMGTGSLPITSFGLNLGITHQIR